MLSDIQSKLKAPKNQTNDFGKYKYRNCEDILEAVKPLLNKHKATLIIFDEIVMVGDRYYIKATVSLKDDSGKEIAYAIAYAREAETKKGMDVAQITGATSSYARKYALNGLFAIDDTKDADNDGKGTPEKDKKKSPPKKPGEKPSNKIPTAPMSDSQRKNIFALIAKYGMNKEEGKAFRDYVKGDSENTVKWASDFIDKFWYYFCGWALLRMGKDFTECLGVFGATTFEEVTPDQRIEVAKACLTHMRTTEDDIPY